MLPFYLFCCRRSNLGLELKDDLPKKKRGRPSNTEKALRAEAAAAAEAESAAETSTFALDPQLGGPTQLGADDTNISARSMSREVSAAASSIQGDRPRKRRRTAAQMEEARRLDEERQAKLAAAKAAKVAKARRESDASAPDTVMAAGHRSARRTRSSNAAEESQQVAVSGEDAGQDGETEEPVIDPQLEEGG